MKWPFVRRFKLDAVLTVNQVYLDEIDRLNQELANELNSHRETKEQKNELSSECDRLYDEVDDLKKELKGTKDALKIAQEELDETKDDLECEIDISKTFIASTNLYMSKCSDAKKEISKARSILKKIAKDL